MSSIDCLITHHTRKERKKDKTEQKPYDSASAIRYEVPEAEAFWWVIVVFDNTLFGGDDVWDVVGMIAFAEVD